MTLDYDKALYYVLGGQWNDLNRLMAETNDDILAKRIEQFLQLLYNSFDESLVHQSHGQLLYYLDHAIEQIPVATMRI